MNDKRFETWWASNPARVALNPAAKEVARGIWRAAQQDLATELVEISKETRAGVNPPPACTNSDSWNCKYCNKTATCAALAAQGTPTIQAGPPRAGMTERKPYAGMTVQVKLPFPPPYRRVPCQPVGLDEVPEDLPWAATRGKGAAC